MMNIYNQQNRGNSELKTDREPVVPMTPTKPADFQKYIDPTGEFTSKDMRRSLWLAQHRVQLYHTLIGLLIFVSAILWAYSVWQWGSYIIFGIADDARLEAQSRQTINYKNSVAHFSATPLQTLSTQIFSSGVSKFDAVSEVANPNEKFVARGTYFYVVDGVKTAPRQFIILPGATALLAELGLSGANEALLVIDSVAWTRVSAHEIKDIKSWQTDHLNFAVKDFNFIPENSGGVVKANVVTFDLVNQSSYSYVEPKFYLGLYSDSVLVGVMPFSVSGLQSLETKKMDLRNFAPGLEARSAELFPLIDIYDPAVYLPPEK